ncbi:MAG: hypothetical protein ABR991_04135 [Terracidiphilus sp.]
MFILIGLGYRAPIHGICGCVLPWKGVVYLFDFKIVSGGFTDSPAECEFFWRSSFWGVGVMGAKRIGALRMVYFLDSRLMAQNGMGAFPLNFYCAPAEGNYLQAPAVRLAAWGSKDRPGTLAELLHRNSTIRGSEEGWALFADPLK